MSETHAKLSASGSTTWLYCPASIRICADLPDDGGSTYATEGTAAHAEAEAALKTGTTPTMVGVQDYVDYVHELMRPDSTLIVEDRVDYNEWVPDGFGTADAVVIHTNGEVDVVDLKYGAGVAVDAHTSNQLRIYGLGVLQRYQWEHGIDTIRLHIVQPRLDKTSMVELKASELLEWGEWVKARALLTAEPTAKAVAGDAQCRWCKAKAVCRTRAIHNLTIAGSDTLTPMDIAIIYPMLDGVSQWVTDTKAHALSILESGGELHGYKLVEGRSTRVLTDNAHEILTSHGLTEEQIYRQSYRTLGDIEAALGGKKAAKVVLDGCTIKQAGKPTVVLNSDPRPAIAADVTSNFQIGE